MWFFIKGTDISINDARRTGYAIRKRKEKKLNSQLILFIKNNLKELNVKIQTANL